MTKITKRLLDDLHIDRSRDVFIWDNAVKGFGVRVKPSGSASFIIQYRNSETRTRRMVIGAVGTLTPDQARDLARDKLHEVAHGSDPSKQRHMDRRALSVMQMCDAYFKDCEAGNVLGKAGTPKRSSTMKTDRSRIASHIAPLIGDRIAAKLTRQDIEKLQRDIVAGKARRARGPGRGGVVTGGHGAASRTLGAFGGICTWAARAGIITNNPCIGVRRHADGKRERFLSDEELRALGAIMHKAEMNPVGLAVIRLLLLTGFRKSEAQTLPWAWVDLKAQCIRFGSTKTTDAKIAKAQIRPLGHAACKLLSIQPKFERCEYVFPASRASIIDHYVGTPKLFAALCEQAGIKDATLHTLRHTFGTVATVIGYSELIIGGLLGHSNGTTTGRYAHTPDPLLVAAADAVSMRIATYLNSD